MVTLQQVKVQTRRTWSNFWMQHAGITFFGKVATRLAALFDPPYLGRCYLAQLSTQGYIAPSAAIHVRPGGLKLGPHVFIGERVVIFQEQNSEPIELGEQVHFYGDSYIQVGAGGGLKIGANTHIQPRCQFSAYREQIIIGNDVQIAPNCAFYPYDHSFVPGVPIRRQALQSKGSIVVGDDAWLGFGVIVLSGVRIGKGAVIGAGAVVTSDVPDGAIAVGMPARVVKMRSDLA